MEKNSEFFQYASYDITILYLFSKIKFGVVAIIVVIITIIANLRANLRITIKNATTV